ncbi:Polysaccharide deacetylase [Stieleria maiorica]|uniref:Polysaccharide deacetylase n=1 Tax=Stieleria maiorica TaxID=2795974 RepID=A0A5B9MK50_9BACT|nr:polysaccharide deacetylase family protein [Stieleria maiorica]QEG01743.1 Polysaccharide deacetylase [Stieleria maiorica]
MKKAREIALHAYYYGTLPMRMRYRRRLEAAGQAPLCVLFYHRVADSHPNGWTIGNREFQRQMRWLKQNADVVSLPEIQTRMRRGRNDRLAVAVTFDDGYAENCEQAIPFLIEHEIPMTYFVALDFVVHARPFPHDLERGIPLPVNTPDQLRQMAASGIEIGAHTRTHCDVGAIADAATMVDEIVTATEELGRLVDRPIRYFAFPYGQTNNLSAAAVHLAGEQGLRGVCSAYGAYNFPGADPFHIQRFHADPEFIRLKNWVTIDRRKVGFGRGYTFPETDVRVVDIAAATIC